MPETSQPQRDNTTEHTPLPWRVRHTTSGIVGWDIVGRDGSCVASSIDDGELHRAADMHFAVRACNAHDDLLAALEDLDKVFDFKQRLDPGDFDIEDHAFASAAFIQARAAIDKAKGKQS